METGTSPGGAIVVDAEPDLGPGSDADARLGEERQILLFGFGLGLTVGLIFLLYVVLGTAHLL